MNILEEIKTAEQKAADIRREAQMNAREIARDGETAASVSVSKMIGTAEQDAVKRLESAREAAEKKAEDFLLKSDREDDAMIAAAEEKFLAAVEYIVTSAGDIR